VKNGWESAFPWPRYFLTPTIEGLAGDVYGRGTRACRHQGPGDGGHGSPGPRIRAGRAEPPPGTREEEASRRPVAPALVCGQQDGAPASSEKKRGPRLSAESGHTSAGTPFMISLWMRCDSAIFVLLYLSNVVIYIYSIYYRRRISHSARRETAARRTIEDGFAGIGETEPASHPRNSPHVDAVRRNDAVVFLALVGAENPTPCATASRSSFNSLSNFFFRFRAIP
jgi:hypothetical protein